MKKILVTVITLIILLAVAGLIESRYCHYMTTTPPPGSPADYIKTNAFCKLNSLPGAIGSILILSPFIDSKANTKDGENIQIKEVASDSTYHVIDTTYWKEYKNDKYKFTIKHPSDWPVSFLDDVVTIGTPESDPVDNYTKCYLTLTFTGNRDGGVSPTPHKYINFVIGEMEKVERCDETLTKIIDSFESLNINKDFPVTLGASYIKIKAVLAEKGWTPAEPNSCMSRGDSICEVSFKKGSQTKIVIIQLKNNEWVVVGYE